MREAGKGNSEGFKKGIGNFLDGGYMHFLSGTDGFMDVYICQKLTNCTPQRCITYCMPAIHIIKLF